MRYRDRHTVGTKPLTRQFYLLSSATPGLLMTCLSAQGDAFSARKYRRAVDKEHRDARQSSSVARDAEDEWSRAKSNFNRCLSCSTPRIHSQPFQLHAVCAPNLGTTAVRTSTESMFLQRQCRGDGWARFVLGFGASVPRVRFECSIYNVCLHSVDIYLPLRELLAFCPVVLRTETGCWGSTRSSSSSGASGLSPQYYGGWGDDCSVWIEVPCCENAKAALYSCVLVADSIHQ